MQKPISIATENSNEIGVKRPSNIREKRYALPVIATLFLLGLFIPLQLHIGPLRLSFYRIILLIVIVPFIIMMLTGRAGKVRSPDILIICYALWAMSALMITHSFENIVEYAGIFFVESVGSYLVARHCIRNSSNFYSFVKFLFYGILFLLPFSAYESISGNKLLLSLFSKIGPVIESVYMEQRMGLDRAQGVFEHPILYGVVCASTLGIVFYVLGSNVSKLIRMLQVGLIGIAVFFSLSSGALLAYMLQIFLSSWNYIMRNFKRRWLILVIIFLVAYVFVDSFSNRTPIEVLVSHITFNSNTSYFRVLIWQYGTESILNNPLFGIGLNEYQRPSWMISSVDNFWLLIAMRYGLPALIFLSGATAIICFKLDKLQNLTTEINQCRRGLFISIIGLSLAASTVHLWNEAYCLFFFLLGSGAWMFDQEKITELEPEKRKYRNILVN